MLPQQRNEAEIERAISYTRKVLNAAENSNQAGEDLIVVMASGADLYNALQGVRHYVDVLKEYHPSSDKYARADFDAAHKAMHGVLSKLEGK